MVGLSLARAHHPAVSATLQDCRRAFWSVAVFSAGVNLLMLAGPLYMLQIYDRVLSSHSVPTLVALTVFLVGALAFQGALDIVRSRVVVRGAALLDHNLGTSVHAAVVRIATQSRNASDAHQPVRDLDQIRAFLTSAGPVAIVDLPWVPVFLVICFLLNPWLGLTALAGALILFALTILNERASRAPARELAQHAGARKSMVEAARRNSESVVAMGMSDTLVERWMAVNNRYLAAVGRTGDISASYGSVSKVMRLLLQSSMLGVGAYLVILNELTAGAMIAAAIMMGRALAPIETAIANWRGFISARQSIRRLSETLARTCSARVSTTLPKPTRSFDVDQLTVVAPGTQAAIVKDVSFHLSAGEALGIIGPSGAGKTSLVRTLVGIWPPARGNVRIDGATIDQWDPKLLGRYAGFVSQGVELFDGTIAENIARMAPSPDNDAMLEAARAAGAHELILQMPAGYDTKIGESGAVLSAGQRQRIALARALYGNPFLLVLDEPNSNLDNVGEAALWQAIEGAKARNAIVILVAHRPAALAVCGKVLLLVNGEQQAYGPRDAILRRMAASQQQAAAKAANLRVVGDTVQGAKR